MSEAPVDLLEMIAEANREIEQRRRVYARLVSEGRMNRKAADRQILRMTAIRDLLVRIQSTPDILPDVLRVPA